MRRAAAVLGLVLALPSAVHGQQGEPVFVSGPIEWSPSVSLVAFGYDSNIFLEPAGRALADISGEEVEAFLLANNLVQANAKTPDAPTNQPCAHEMPGPTALNFRR